MITVYVPKTLEAELPIEQKIEGYFIVELVDAKTQKVKQRLEFKNLLTDVALNSLGAGTWSLGNLVQYMGVGTGSTVPAVTDTTLVSQVARTNFNQGFADVSGFGPSNTYVYYRIVRVFIETEANGNLTEVGMFQTNVAGTMFTRQLLKDGTGTPTVITKTSADQLRITYEYRLAVPITDNGGTINISGTSYDWTNRPYKVVSDWPNLILNYPNNFIAWSLPQWAYETDVLVNQDSGTLAGTQVASTSHGALAYTTGNFYRDVETIWDPGIANFATGVGAVSTAGARFATNGWWQAWQTKFSPKIPKTNVKRLKLTFRHYFNRV